MFTNTVLPDTFRALKLVSDNPHIQQAYLAGGTALALQIGHRISVDLDFFTQEHFNETELSTTLSQYPEFIPAGTAAGTVWGTIGETKFSIFYYQYPLLEQTVPFAGLKLAGLADIAAMKIHAVERRGTKRDFMDVYFLSKTYTLEQMLAFYQKKYGALEDHLYTILRSLDYFEDAEKESEMPKMVTEVTWSEVKEYFTQETNSLIKKKLQTER